MKFRPLVFFAVLAGLARAGTDLSTPDALATALQDALATKDALKLAALADTAGLPERDLTQHEQTIRELAALGPVFSLSLGELPPDLPESFVVNGRRFAPSHPPVGVLTVTFKTPDGLTSRKIPYTVVEGRHLMVSTRSWRLPWSGPPDHQIKFALSGPGSDSAEVRVRYNASGLDQERTIRSDAAGFWGQYFHEVSARITHPAAKVRLTVWEDGKTVFTSDLQQGPGTVAYKRAAPTSGER
jgi:hypothetical protein